MVYTLTANPSLDYVMELDELLKGQMNRSQDTHILPGGKGINVSYVLNQLGVENKAILLSAGFTGEKLKSLLEDAHVFFDAIELPKGETRINVKVIGKEETEINASGIVLSEVEYERVLEQVVDRLNILTQGDILILSGSTPNSFQTDFYAKVIKKLESKDIQVVLDTSGRSFLEAVKQKPFLVKPNYLELKEICHALEYKGESVVAQAEMLQKLGAKNVLVSFGKDGAILLTEDGNMYRQMAPDGVVKNTVGAGDSMVAGFVATYLEKQDFEAALKMAVATGSASAFSKKLATKEEINALFEKM